MERGSECDVATKERGNTNERAKRTTRAEVATSGAGGGSEMKVRADVGDVGDGGSAYRNATDDPRGTTARTEADRPPVMTQPKVNNRAAEARAGASRRGRSLLYSRNTYMSLYTIYSNLKHTFCRAIHHSFTNIQEIDKIYITLV